MELFIVGVIVIWLIFLTYLVFRKSPALPRVREGLQGDLAEVFSKSAALSEENAVRIQDILMRLEKTEKGVLLSFKKIGFFRFNPYRETGGDQSFVLALLDGHDNGFVVSSLHGRTGTRIYAKPVEKGNGAGYELSAEEKKAVALALKQG